ncbi:MAG: nuclear transport factor 2 family protein [Bryobacteraceae bacterium]
MEANIEVVRSAFDDFMREDIAALLDKLADDIEWNDPGSPAIPYAGSYHGRADVANFFARMAETTEVLHFDPQQYLVSGNWVGVFGSWQARARRTGEVFESDWAMLFTVRDGRIIRFQAYVDTAVEAAAYQQGAAHSAG